MERQLDVPSFIVFGVDVTVKNTEVFNVAMEMQYRVPSTPLSRYAIYRTAVNNDQY